MTIPTCYEEGFPRARALDPEIASRYIAHTLIEDPEADAVVDLLASLEPTAAARFVSAAMDQDEDELASAPRVLRDFFEGLETVPSWVDFSAFAPGIRMFHRNSRLVLAAFVAGTLIEGFATNIAKSFLITGRLRESGVRRLRQNNRHIVEIFIPGGLQRTGDGWKLSVRIRLIHARVRRLLKHSDDWDEAAWGAPLSAAHVGYSITAFSARLLHHMAKLGAKYTDEERESFLAVWRYSGFLMGIPETMLFRDEAEALRIFDVGNLCEPAPDWDCAVMANSLVNAAPLVAGITDPVERRDLANYVYSVSRALIGDALADSLKYPRRSTFGVLPWFRTQGRYNRLAGYLFPKYARHNNYTNFTGLMEVSEFDMDGISYRMPDHVHDERSSKW